MDETCLQIPKIIIKKKADRLIWSKIIQLKFLKISKAQKTLRLNLHQLESIYLTKLMAKTFKTNTGGKCTAIALVKA